MELTFFTEALMVLVFGFVTRKKIKVLAKDKHFSYCWEVLAQHQGFCLSLRFPPKSLLGLAENFRRDTARTGDPNWWNVYSGMSYSSINWKEGILFKVVFAWRPSVRWFAGGRWQVTYLHHLFFVFSLFSLIRLSLSQDFCFSHSDSFPHPAGEE